MSEVHRTEQPELSAILSADEIVKRIQAGVQIQGRFASDTATNHGIDEARRLYEERFGPTTYVSGFHPDDLAKQPHCQYSAEEIASYYASARDDGFALGSVSRISRGIKHTDLRTNKISRLYEPEMNVVEQWVPNSDAALAEACNNIILGYESLAAASDKPAAQEFGKLLQRMAAKAPQEYQEKILETKAQIVISQVTESYKNQDSLRLNRLSEVAAYIGIQEISIQSAPQASLTTPITPVVHEQATHQPLVVPTNDSPKPRTSSSHTKERPLTPLPTEVVASVQESGSKAIPKSLLVGAALGATMVASLNSPASAIESTHQDLKVEVTMSAAALPQTVAMPVSSASIYMSRANTVEAGPIASAPTNIPTAADGGYLKTASQIESDPNIVTSVEPDALTPVDIQEMAAADSASGDPLTQSVESYADQTLQAPEAPKTEGSVAATVASDVANLEQAVEGEKGKTPHDPEAFHASKTLAKLLAERPTLLQDHADDPNIQNLVQMVNDNVNDPLYVKTRVEFLKSQLPALSGEKEYTEDQQHQMLTALISAESQLLTDHERTSTLKALGVKVPEHHQAKPSHQTDRVSRHGNRSESVAHNQLPPSKYNRGNYKKTWEFFNNDKDLGLSPVGVAALMGNFSTETGGTMNPRIVQGFNYSDHLPASILGKLGYGLNQSTSIDRQKHMIRVAERMGLPAGTLAVQHQYIKEELMQYPNLLGLLRKNDPKLLDHMTVEVEKQYERAGVDAWESRKTYANAVFRANSTGGYNQSHTQERTGETMGVPNDPNQRIAFFANSLGLSPSDIRVYTGSSGILHFQVRQSAWSKLGINEPYNGYGQQYVSAAKDAYVDPSGMYSKECVSFAAWMVAHDKYPGGMPQWGGRGNAELWDSNARSAGIKSDHKLTTGAVLQWDTNGPEHQSLGHVAYIVKGFGNWGVYAEVNGDGQGGFDVQILSPQNLKMNHNQIEILHFEQGKQGRATWYAPEGSVVTPPKPLTVIPANGSSVQPNAGDLLAPAKPVEAAEVPIVPPTPAPTPPAPTPPQPQPSAPSTHPAPTPPEHSTAPEHPAPTPPQHSSPTPQPAPTPPQAEAPTPPPAADTHPAPATPPPAATNPTPPASTPAPIPQEVDTPAPAPAPDATAQHPQHPEHPDTPNNGGNPHRESPGNSDSAQAYLA